MSDNELIQKINEFKLELDCPIIELTQRAVENPVVFHGTGTIFQDVDGSLSLKLCHMLTGSQGILESDLDMKYFDGPGKIISDRRYFDMECTDTYGRVWQATKILLKKEFYSQSRSVIIRSIIKNISRKYKRVGDSNSGYIDYFVPYAVELPCNKSEKYGNGGSRLSIYKLEINGVGIEVNNANDNLQIYSTTPVDVNEEVFGEGLIFALSILVGRLLTPIIKIHSGDGWNHMEVRSVDVSVKKSIPRPIVSKVPYPAVNASNFISQFVCRYLTEQESMKDLIGYWHKLYCSYGSSIEVIALTLTTSIEGLFKKYYQEYYENEDQYLKLIDDAIGETSKLDIHADIKGRIKTALGGYRKKSVKNALKAFVKNKQMYLNTPDTWSSLRNQSAHADSLTGGFEATQKYFDKYNVCLSLFYLIILDTVNYEGERIMYNYENWPNADINGITIASS